MSKVKEKAYRIVDKDGREVGKVFMDQRDGGLMVLDGNVGAFRLVEKVKGETWRKPEEPK